MEVQSDNANFTTPFHCILNKSDSSSTVGWLCKSNHEPIGAPIHNEVARFHARNMMTWNAYNYSQHFPGKLNVMIDSFSRDFHLSNNQIISMLTLLHSSLSTSLINMIKLPQKHTSSVAQLAQMAQKWPGKKGSPHQLIKREISAGISGWDYSTGSTTTTTPIWTRLKHKQKIASKVLLCMRYDAVVLGENLSKETL